MKSIKSKLLLTLIPVFIIALTTVSWINHNKAKDFLETSFEEKAFLQLDLLRTTVDDQIAIHRERIQNIAEGSNVSSMNRILQIGTLKQRDKEYDLLFVANKKGEAYTTTDQQVNVSEREYFKKIMNGDSFAISDPVVSKASGETVIVVAAPIKHGNSVVGMLGASMPLNVLTELANEIKIGETGYASIIQNDGTFIVHPSEDLLMKKKLQELDVPALRAAYEQIQKGEKGFKRYEFAGEERYIFYESISEADWGVLEVVPVKEATSQLAYLAMLSFVTAGVVILFAILMIVTFASRLVKPLRALSNVTSEVAQGDLTKLVEHGSSNDEVGTLGKNFNTMIQNMQAMILKVQDVSQHVKISSDTLVASSEETKQSAEQVAVTIQELANGTTDIASSVTNTTHKMTSMLETVDNISTYTDDVISTSEQSKRSAEKGKNYSDEALQKMDNINAKVLETSEIIRKLDSQSKEIGNIVSMITNIAEQTNLLALNASIEAARAGEHGKGFAVVAEEVRKLANETTSSAEKISSLISETQKESKRAVDAAEQGTKVVDEGTVTVKQTAEVFSEITSFVDDVLNKNKEIHDEITRLKHVANLIGNDMESISAVTEEASAGAEEVSATSQQQASSANIISDDASKLATLADDLKEMMKQFKV